MRNPSSPVRSSLAAAEIAARLRLSATRLARRLRQESGAGLSPSQQSALAVIANHGPLTLGSLADPPRPAPPAPEAARPRLRPWRAGRRPVRARPGDRRLRRAGGRPVRQEAAADRRAVAGHAAVVLPGRPGLTRPSAGTGHLRR